MTEPDVHVVRMSKRTQHEAPADCYGARHQSIQSPTEYRLPPNLPQNRIGTWYRRGCKTEPLPLLHRAVSGQLARVVTPVCMVARQMPPAAGIVEGIKNSQGLGCGAMHDDDAVSQADGEPPTLTFLPSCYFQTTTIWQQSASCCKQIEPS